MIPLRKLVRKLALSAASLGLFFLGAEIVLRAVEPGPFSFLDHDPYTPAAKPAGKFHKPGFVGRWDATWYEINALGMRGPAFEPTFDQQEFRVLCVGDSCTLGKGVLDKETWPRLLETKLAEAFANDDSGRRTLLGNLGLNGADGRIYDQLYREVGEALKPQLVVVGYNLNDFPNSIQAIDQTVYREASLRRLIPDGLRDSMNRSALYRYARATYYESRRRRDWRVAEEMAAQSSSESLDSPVWQEQRKYIKSIKDRAATHGGKTMVLLFPYQSQLYLANFDTTAIDRMGELCAELDLPFVNLASSFVEAAKISDLRYFLRGDRYHPNPAGYEVVASAIMQKLGEQGWFGFSKSTAAPSTN
jgi:lysophospholipase L1-like esterase